MVITQNGSNNVIANLEKLKDSNITLTKQYKNKEN